MPHQNPLPPVLRHFIFGSILFTLLCGATELFCKLVLHLHFPYTFPIVDPGAITQDLLLHVRTFRHLHHRDFFNQAGFFYPAPAAIPYALFLLSPSHASLAYYSVCAAIVLIAFLVLGRALTGQGLGRRTAAGFLAASLVLSYPLWFLLKQGNIEIVLFAVLAIGIWAFLRGNSWGAAAAFGVAGSIKLYPFFFLGLLLARRQYARIVFGLLVAAAVTLFSLWLEDPSIPYSWQHTNEGIAAFHLGYVVGFRPEQAFDHSLWGFTHSLLPARISLHTVTVASDLYLLVAGSVGLFLYFWRIQHLPVVNQVLCLTVAAISFMPVSFDYTLIHLYIPWALLVLLAAQATRERRHIPGLAAAFLCFTVLCSPQTELISHAATLEGRIKTIALVALLVVGLIYPFRFASAETLGDSSLPKGLNPSVTDPGRAACRALTTPCYTSSQR